MLGLDPGAAERCRSPAAIERAREADFEVELGDGVVEAHESGSGFLALGEGGLACSRRPSDATDDPDGDEDDERGTAEHHECRDDPSQDGCDDLRHPRGRSQASAPSTRSRSRQLVDIVDRRLGTVCLVRPAEAPAHEDHRDAVHGAALDVVMPVADQDGAAGVEPLGVEAAQGLGDDVGLGAQRALVEGRADDRGEMRRETEVVHEGVDLDLGLGARRRLRDAVAAEIRDELADTREELRAGGVAVGLAERAVERHGLGGLRSGVMPTFAWNDSNIGGPIQCTSSARVGGFLPKCSSVIVRRRRMPSEASTTVPSTSHRTQVHGERIGMRSA